MTHLRPSVSRSLAVSLLVALAGSACRQEVETTPAEPGVEVDLVEIDSVLCVGEPATLTYIVRWNGDDQATICARSTDPDAEDCFDTVVAGDSEGNHEQTFETTILCGEPGERTVTMHAVTFDGPGKSFDAEDSVTFDCEPCGTTSSTSGEPDTSGSPDTSGGTDTTDGGSDTGGEPSFGKCGAKCDTVDDCYTPPEEECVAGVCVNACSVKGCSGAAYTCVTRGGLDDCVLPCAVDADCPGLLCNGVADGGEKFCVGPRYAPCQADADCDPGYEGGVCDTTSGTCGCVGDADCSSSFDACGHA